MTQVQKLVSAVPQICRKKLFYVEDQKRPEQQIAFKINSAAGSEAIRLIESRQEYDSFESWMNARNSATSTLLDNCYTGSQITGGGFPLSRVVDVISANPELDISLFFQDENDDDCDNHNSTSLELTCDTDDDTQEMEEPKDVTEESPTQENQTKNSQTESETSMQLKPEKASGPITKTDSLLGYSVNSLVSGHIRFVTKIQEEQEAKEQETERLQMIQEQNIATFNFDIDGIRTSIKPEWKGEKFADGSSDLLVLTLPPLKKIKAVKETKKLDDTKESVIKTDSLSSVYCQANTSDNMRNRTTHSEGISESSQKAGPSQKSGLSKSAVGSPPKVSQSVVGSNPKHPQSSVGSTPNVSQSAVGSTPKDQQSSVGSASKISQSAIGSTPKNSQSAVGSTPKNSQSAVGSTPKVSQSAVGSAPKDSDDENLYFDVQIKPNDGGQNRTLRIAIPKDFAKGRSPAELVQLSAAMARKVVKEEREKKAKESLEKQTENGEASTKTQESDERSEKVSDKQKEVSDKQKEVSDKEKGVSDKEKGVSDEEKELSENFQNKTSDYIDNKVEDVLDSDMSGNVLFDVPQMRNGEQTILRVLIPKESAEGRTKSELKKLAYLSVTYQMSVSQKKVETKMGKFSFRNIDKVVQDRWKNLSTGQRKCNSSYDSNHENWSWNVNGVDPSVVSEKYAEWYRHIWSKIEEKFANWHMSVNEKEYAAKFCLIDPCSPEKVKRILKVAGDGSWKVLISTLDGAREVCLDADVHNVSRCILSHDTLGEILKILDNTDVCTGKFNTRFTEKYNWDNSDGKFIDACGKLLGYCIDGKIVSAQCLGVTDFELVKDAMFRGNEACIECVALTDLVCPRVGYRGKEKQKVVQWYADPTEVRTKWNNDGEMNPEMEEELRMRLAELQRDLKVTEAEEAIYSKSQKEGYVCKDGKCFFFFVNKNDFLAHMEKKHPEFTNTKLGITYHENCPECGIRVKKGNLKEHIESAHVSEEGKFECEICGKKLLNKITLTAHMTQIHGAVRTICCEICGSNFKRPQSLYKHMRVVHGSEEDKKFKCPDCTEAFFTGSQLKTHRLKHLKEPPLRCKYCPQRYYSQSSLYKHVRSKHRVKQYTCPYCENTYPFNDKLQAHIKSVHFAVAVDCDGCGKTYKNATLLASHQKNGRCHGMVERKPKKKKAKKRKVETSSEEEEESFSDESSNGAFIPVFSKKKKTKLQSQNYIKLGNKPSILKTSGSTKRPKNTLPHTEGSQTEVVVETNVVNDPELIRYYDSFEEAMHAIEAEIQRQNLAEQGQNYVAMTPTKTV